MHHCLNIKMPRRWLSCLFASALSLTSLCLNAAEKNPYQMNFPVEKFVLDNGLTVLLQEDHSSPIVSYHT